MAHIQYFPNLVGKIVLRPRAFPQCLCLDFIKGINLDQIIECYLESIYEVSYGKDLKSWSIQLNSEEANVVYILWEQQQFRS